MPKSSSHLAIARQWEMLRKIPTHPRRITAAELTAFLKEQGFPVSKRTVERDLNDLSALFPLSCNSESFPYQWHWLPGKNCNFESIEIADAVSICLAQDVLVKILPATMLDTLAPKFRQAREKLSVLKGLPLSRWPEKVRYIPAALSTIPPRLAPRVMDTTFEALVKERQIEVKYAPFQKKPSPYTLHPLGLVQKGGTAYLVATAFEFEDPRLYALHRMESVRILDKKAKRPPGYSLDQYLATGAMEFGSGKELKLKAEVSIELGTYLSETKISEDQNVSFKNGRWIFTATIRDTWQLHFWILSQGPAITILSPASLRSRVRESLEAAVKSYS